MAENYRRPRLEEDDYELIRLRKRQKRKHEEYLRRKRREKSVIITAVCLLCMVALIILAGYVRGIRAEQGDFNDVTGRSLNTTGASAGSERTEKTSAEGKVIVTLPQESSSGETSVSEPSDPATEPDPTPAAEPGTPAEPTAEPTAPAETSPADTDPNAPQPLTEQGPETVFEKAAAIPSWITKDLLHISKKNRPGEKLDPVKNVVIHWVGNAGSSAKDNRDYFETLANPDVNTEGIGASSHFIVGLRGEVLQCVPIEEVAYANYPRNNDTISIEVCHPDWEGKFSDVTYASVIKLAAWALEISGLTADDLIRHYDVRGKECPKYYVQHPEAWEQLKADVRQYMSDHPDIANEFP